MLNNAAENCVAWLELDGSGESYQLSWVGGSATVTINVGDHKEVDLCARNHGDGSIIAPTESGYFPHQRRVGDGSANISGRIRVTARNGRKVDRGIVINPVGQIELDISLVRR